MGAVPNSRVDALTIGEALAIREGDAFAGFRSELRRSLDGFDHGHFDVWSAAGR
jgi:chemotaxis methyl-accepting protein methylase